MNITDAINREAQAVLQKAIRTDATVHRMIQNGESSLEAVIAQLVDDKKALEKRLMELEMIAPRKIRLPDGRVMIYSCPDELVPE